MKNESITNVKDPFIAITNLTVAESKMIVDSIDSMIVDAINYVNSGLTENNKPSINILLIQENKKFINALYGSIKNKFINKAATGTDYQKVISKKILENLNDVFKYHAKKSNLLKEIKIVIHEFGSNNNLIKNLENNKGEVLSDSDVDKTSLEVHGEPIVFALLAGLFYCNENGETEYNRLGEKKLANYKITKNRATKILSGQTDENEMYKALLKESEQYPEFTQLIMALGNPSDYQGNRFKQRLWMKVRQTFAMTRVPIYQTYFIYDEQGLLDIRFLESNTDLQKIAQQFASNFRSNLSPYVSVDNNGIKVLNVEKLFDDFTDTYIDNKTSTQYVLIKNDKRKEFLNAIGFQFSDKRQIEIGINSFNKINFLVQKIQLIHQQGIKITNPIKQMREITKNEKNIVINKGESNNVKYLLTLEAQFSDDYSNYSVINPNGDNVYELSEYNGLTTTADMLNNAIKYPTYQDLIQEPDMYRFDISKNPLVNGLILNSLFDLQTGKRRYEDDYVTPVTLQVVRLIGENILTEYNLSNADISIIELDMKDKQLFHINVMLATGMEATPQHEAKSSYYGFKVSKVANTETINAAFGYMYFPMKSFITKGRLHREIIDYLKKGLIGELTRTGWLNEGLALQELAKKEERENTSDELKIISKGGADIEGYNKRAKSLTLFDGMLSEPMKAKLLKLVEKNTPNDLADQVKAFNSELDAEFTKYMSAMVAETWNQVKNNFIVGKGIMNKLSSYIANTDSNKKDNTTLIEKQQILTKAYAINSLVAKMESSKVFYGDPAFYNLDKEEANKRIAGFGSTKSTFSLSPGSIDYVNNYLGRHVARSMGITEKKFDGTFGTRIYQDVKVNSALMGTPVNPAELRQSFTEYFENKFKNKSPERIKELVEQILESYTKMKEGDAQGFITFDAWRIAKVLQGQWNDEMERLYQKEVNGEELTLEEFNFFFAIMKAQYTGPLQTSHLYVPALHKCFLMPLLPSMIRGTSMEAINRDMMEEGHDYATFVSGSKIAIIGKPQPFYSDLATHSPNIPKLQLGEPSPFVTNTINLRYFGEIRY